MRGRCMAIMLAAGSLSVAACGQGGDNDAAVLVPESISIMEFRPAPEGSDLLGKRFMDPKIGFSIRPPAGWLKVERKAKEKTGGQLHRVSFRSPDEGDGLDILAAERGPKELTPRALGDFTEGYLRELRQTGILKPVGTDMFRFKRFTAVQVLSQAGDLITLQLMVFRKPGEFLQLTFAVASDSYAGAARAIEASIESLEWPLPDQEKVDTDRPSS